MRADLNSDSWAYPGLLSRRVGIAIWLAASTTGWVVAIAISYGLVETLR
jgi:hypothetical protein